jgi:hypothetical protein
LSRVGEHPKGGRLSLWEAMRVLRRCVMVVALLQQGDLVSALVPTPQLHLRGAAHSAVHTAGPFSPLAVAGRVAGGRCALRLQMGSGREAVAEDCVGGPDLGRRPSGPDPFAVVQGDIKRIKAKIKRIADNAMSSSSACPLVCRALFRVPGRMLCPSHSELERAERSTDCKCACPQA